MNDLLKLLDLSGEEIVDILNMADQLKYERKHEMCIRDSLRRGRGLQPGGFRRLHQPVRPAHQGEGHAGREEKQIRRSR